MTWAPPDREPFIAPYYDPLAYNHDNYLRLLKYIDTLGGEPPAAIEDEVFVSFVVDQLATPYDASLNFTGTVVSYSMTFTPIGMTFDTNTGILSGTPTSIQGGRPAVVAHGEQFDAAFVLDFVVTAS